MCGVQFPEWHETLLACSLFRLQVVVIKSFGDAFCYNMIKRDTTKVPKRMLNAAASLIEDTLVHCGVSKAEAARAMNIPRSRLSDIIAGRKGVSADTALRFEQCFAVRAEWLMRLQAKYDYYKAYHEKAQDIKNEVKPLVV